ncbi:MAG: RsmB/NOP family class I SAM-dependent RNA methyltransferase [Myxococcaceae bacterium]
MLEGEALKRALSASFEEGSGLGGQERRFVAFATRELSRHQRLLDVAAKLAGQPPGELSLVQDRAIVRYALWRKVFTGEGWTRIGAEVKLPGPVRPRSIPDSLLERIVQAELPDLPMPPGEVERAATLHSFPGWLAEDLARAAPEGEIARVLEALNREGPLILRARGGRERVIAALAAEELLATPLEEAPEAIAVEGQGARIFDSRLMKGGRLQVMDLGSQLIVELCRAGAGMTALDYCAGAGGKALALADRVGPTGKVIAFDRSRRRLDDARDRARRMGLSNLSFPAEPKLAEADVLLVDAPCSGTGSLAREPEQKWKLTRARVAEFRGRQLEILSKVAAGARPGAAVVYATCSLLEEEDEEVVETFLARHPEFQLEGGTLRVWPHRGPGGGFFGARLVKRG